MTRGIKHKLVGFWRNAGGVERLAAKAGILVASLLLCFVVLDWLFPFAARPEYSQIVTDAKGKVLSAYLTSDEKWRMKAELEEITPDLRKVILFKEDKYFYYHPGINPVAVCRALFNNLVQGRRTSGASTVTMQLARLLDPKPRTYANKLLEMFRALQLEWHLGKDEILQLYLNLVPYGGNIEGVKSAALLFFDKMPNHLSLAEITALSIIPNRPVSLALGKNNASIQSERNKWLERIAKSGLFGETTVEDALLEPLEAVRRNAPQNAPHLSRRMCRSLPDEAIIKTTLKSNVQKQAETTVGQHISRLYNRNIRNAAVLVVNNQTREVEAYVGSADFGNGEDGGQVDGITALRSPGSTLKPLLYALAFDDGLVTPQQKLSDVPVNFSGYAPKNYDEEYHGLVSVSHALAHSLNVPAVKILNDYGEKRFIGQLAGLGFGNIGQNRNLLGLSVVLGGCGVTLEELTTLYAGFAKGGRLPQLHLLRPGKGKVWADSLRMPFISEAAAYVITDILAQPLRPDLPNNAESGKNVPNIAWKTGTSYGRRDAWSIGYNKNYTIGVWVGNFSGEGVPELTGADIATPLLFQLFKSIDRGKTEHDWYAAPRSLGYRWVCSETGLPPNEFCEHQTMDVYLPGVSTNKVCGHLQKTYLSPDGELSYCTSCLPPSGYAVKWLPKLPPEVAALYDRQNIPYQKPPPHNPGCVRVFDGNAFEITAPVDGLEYLIDPADNDELMLACNAAVDASQIYWYVNGQFFKSAEADEHVFFKPKSGSNKIACVDDKGRKKEITVLVKSL